MWRSDLTVALLVCVVSCFRLAVTAGVSKAKPVIDVHMIGHTHDGKFVCMFVVVCGSEQHSLF
jgi:hypothetical protein